MKIEEAIHSDAALDASLGQFQVVQPEDCAPGDQKLERMCVNPDRNSPSLICSDLSTTRQKDFLANILEIEGHLINDLRRKEDPLTEEYGYGYLEKRHISTLSKICWRYRVPNHLQPF